MSDIGRAAIQLLQSDETKGALVLNNAKINDLVATTLTSFKVILISWCVSYVIEHVVDTVVKLTELKPVYDAFNKTTDVNVSDRDI